MKKKCTTPAMESLRNLARYKTHGGYVWAAVMIDGELICNQCACKEYRLIFKATRDKDSSGWQCVGITHSGESEQTETCAHCNKDIWTHEPEEVAP